MSKLFNNSIFNPSLIIQRFYILTRHYKWDEGIKYFGFKYYPRDPNFKDPPCEASKLFRVSRIKPLKGRPRWEKQIMTQFHLDGKLHNPVVIKNIPENNHKLYKVKHLIEIVPITFPDGFPKDATGTFLKENGELVVKKTLQVAEERLKLTEAFQKNPEKMDPDTLRRDSRRRWLTAWQ